MDLVSLEIERFGCIGRAQIEFKRGLNVLYGANEVGKSSIAQSIRFALLLPSSSNAAEPWIPWSGGGNPAVTLVFRSDADCYRVKKLFGTSTASLERSSDCNGWANLARGREVEARLRGLLQWGIPEPGGARAPKGVPESFLASALLADQDEVAIILEQDLERDVGDSGRIRVRDALQAMVQDPLFKSVLDAAQSRVDEAFTPNGQRKRGASDPFKKMSDEVTARQRERDEAEKAAISSRLLTERVVMLHRSVVAAESDLQEKTEHREKLEQGRSRQRALLAAVGAREAGQGLLDAVIEAEKRVAAVQAICLTLESRIPTLRTAAEQARKTFETATADDSAVREKRASELAQEEAAILRERETLRVRSARVQAALDQRKAQELRQKGDTVANTLKEFDAAIEALEAVELWTEVRVNREALEAVIQREQKADELLVEAAELRSRAAAEWPTPQSHQLPDARRLAELRKLDQGLELAEAKLDVGLWLEVRGALSATASVDGGVKKAKSSPFTLEAKTSADIQLGGAIEITVRGGRTGDRENAERRRKEWRDATESLFASVGVTDLAALEEVCRLDFECRSRAEVLKQNASTRDAERNALGDGAPEKERLTARILELERRLEGRDLAAIELAAAGANSNALIRIRADRESQRTRLANLRAQEAACRERLPEVTDTHTMVDLDSEGSAVTQAMQALDARAVKLVEARQLLSSPPVRRNALSDALTNAEKALDNALAEMASATSDRDSWMARLQERSDRAIAVDIEALKSAEDVASDAAKKDGAPIDDAAIASARRAEETAKTQYDRELGELRMAEGALQASGGAAADERLREVEAALQRSHEKQASLEDDYEAWKLLAEVLREAEHSQSTHLGKVLAPDVAARLQAVAGERYSGIALSPHLGLEGIESAGGRRALSRLSIGTREQLSTLFRLCLAERLQTALLLDDQLVQSDPDRMRWFRKALRQTAGKGVQIVVLTCRPDDYLEPAESPSPNIVDLSRVSV